MQEEGARRLEVRSKRDEVNRKRRNDEVTLALARHNAINSHCMNAPVNPNKALWEKGDFTRIADTMRKSGEAFVEKLGITK